MLVKFPFENIKIWLGGDCEVITQFFVIDNLYNQK